MTMSKKVLENMLKIVRNVLVTCVAMAVVYAVCYLLEIISSCGLFAMGVCFEYVKNNVWALVVIVLLLILGSALAELIWCLLKKHKD